MLIGRLAFDRMGWPSLPVFSLLRLGAFGSCLRRAFLAPELGLERNRHAAGSRFDFGLRGDVVEDDAAYPPAGSVRPSVESAIGQPATGNEDEMSGATGQSGQHRPSKPVEPANMT